MKVEVKNLPKELRKRGLKKRLVEVCKKEGVVFLAVFGSFVRGEQNKKSDVDIVIKFDKNSEKSLLDLVRIEDELKKIFRRRVDVGILDSLSPYIIEDVKKEMQVIYEKR